MPTDYTDADSARTIAAEHSSAGRQTQPLQPLPVQATPPARQGASTIAIALIVIGALMLLGKFAGIASPSYIDSEAITAGMVLLTIASCLLFFAFWKRIYALAIPGCILVGLSIGVPLADLSNGISVVWGLALAFMMMLLLGRSLFQVRSTWPIYPAVALFAVGVIIAVSTLPLLLGAGLLWLPILLVGLGLYLGWGRGSRNA